MTWDCQGLNLFYRVFPLKKCDPSVTPVKVSKVLKGDAEKFRVIIPPGVPDPKSDEPPEKQNVRKARQRVFNDEGKATRFARILNEGRTDELEQFVGLSRRDQVLIMQAVAKAGGAQSALDSVLEIGDKAIREKRLLSDVIEDCLERKTAARCREGYLVHLRLMFKRFLDFTGDKLMSDVTRADVERFLASPRVRIVKGNKRESKDPAGAWTQRSRWIDLKNLFSFAVGRGHCKENHLLKIDPVRIDSKDPSILTPEQVRELLAAIRAKYPHLVAYAALCLFGGLRSSEAKQLTWEEIKDRDTIIVQASVAKGNRRQNLRRRRLITINETLRAWLKVGGELPVTEYRVRRLRKLLKPWPKNGLRHSFVSYSYALHGAKDTAGEAGHSEEVLHSNYRELVTRQDAEKFWELRPS